MNKDIPIRNLRVIPMGVRNANQPHSTYPFCRMWPMSQGTPHFEQRKVEVPFRVPTLRG